MKKHLKTIGMIITSSMIGFSPTNASDVVATTILAEARGEGKPGMYAVACVIAQRSKNRGISAEKVCLQKWQFSCWNANDPQRGKLKSLLKLKEAEYAKTLASNIHNLDRSYTGYADHYHTKSVKPYWSKGKKPVKVIGNHLFFKLR
jgi:spore germination cell wall hydrolase CwlJ-like protein